MPKYLIERNIEGAGKLSKEELEGISRKPCGVLKGMGEAGVREHARQGGFPADKVSEIKTVIDPTTAESAA